MVIETTYELGCPHCATLDLPLLKRNGPHIEARCRHCGRHIKFVPLVSLSLKELRAAIWKISNEDEQFIDGVKQNLYADPDKWMYHWKLYVMIWDVLKIVK